MNRGEWPQGDLGSPVHVVLTLCANGLRKGDPLILTKAAYDAERGWIAANTAIDRPEQKVQWPVIAPLRAIPDAARGHDAITLAATSKGRPWSVAGFDTARQRLRTRLETDGEIEPGLTLHGLRHSKAHVLAEQGFSLRSIADALGHSSENTVRQYSRAADLTKKMAKMVFLTFARPERGQNCQPLKRKPTSSPGAEINDPRKRHT